MKPVMLSELLVDSKKGVDIDKDVKEFLEATEKAAERKRGLSASGRA